MQITLRTNSWKCSTRLFPTLTNVTTLRTYSERDGRKAARPAQAHQHATNSTLYASGREQFRSIALRKPGGAEKKQVVVDECDFYTPEGVSAINEAARKLSEEFDVSVAIVNLSHIGVQDNPLLIAMELFDAWFPEDKTRAILFLHVESAPEFVIRDTQSGWLATMTGQNVLFSDTFVRFYLQPKLRDSLAECDGTDKPEHTALALVEAIETCYANLKRRRLHDWFEFLPHGLAFYSFFLTPFPWHYFLPILLSIIINRRIKNSDY